MAQKRENLPLVHLHIDAIDGLEAVREHFEQVLHFEEFVLEFHGGDFRGHSFIVLPAQVLHLEMVTDRPLHRVHRLPQTFTVFELGLC